MKYKKLFPVVLLITLAALPETNARTRPRRRKPPQTRRKTRTHRTKPANSDQVEFDLCYDFSIQAMPSKLNFVILIPKTIPDRQKILDIKYSTEPEKVFSKNGNTYAEFVFPKPKTQFQLKISVKALLYRYDLSTAQEKQEGTTEKIKINDFLKHEPYIEKDDPTIQQVAENINGQTETETARNIYEYITNHLKYVPRTDELGAAKALQKKQGDCIEYADLFVALCRAKNIPARVVKGYVTEFDVSPEHAWGEVYLKDLGWVPFDLIYGDVEQKSVKNDRFQKLKPIYIYLTNIRNDKILDQAITVKGLWVGDVILRDSIVFK
ncbi:MAG: transglutaminase-like domain-containing protein [Planctomycetota bacterium]|jgi:transglutaminase-like putative cysteine protease